jgi:hypothetical protein
MARDKGFSLIPQAVPARQRSSLYKEIVAEFIKSGEKSAVVAGTDRKPVTLVQGLRKALEAGDVTNVKVVQRGSEIFLIRE